MAPNQEALADRPSTWCIYQQMHGKASPTRALALAALVFLAGCAWSGPAHAQRQLDQQQSDSWLITHGSLTLSAAALSLGVGQATTVDPLWEEPWGFERRTQRNFSRFTSGATDYTLSAVMLAPVIAFAGEPGTQFFLNSSLIYLETLNFSVALNRIVKVTVRRSRPFVHNRDPLVQGVVEAKSGDANQSFYSGHASASFTSASAGSLLFDAADRPDAAKAGFWALQFALAGFTATGRVRAGNHYPTDVFVGAVVGTGLGFLVPWLHDVPFDLGPTDWAGITGGLVLGVGVGVLFPRIAAELEGVGLEPVPGGASLRYRASW